MWPVGPENSSSHGREITEALNIMFVLQPSTSEAFHYTLRFAEVDSMPGKSLTCSHSSGGGLEQNSHSVRLSHSLGQSPSALSPVSLALYAGAPWSIFSITKLQSQSSDRHFENRLLIIVSTNIVKN